MTRQEALEKLLLRRAELQSAGVRHLFLFGSTARDQARANSDVDMFFDYEKGKFGLFDLVDVRDLATDILGVPADITTRDSLHPTLRARIEADAVRVF